MFERVTGFFKRLTFSQRFMLAGLVIVLLGMLGIGAWMQQQITSAFIHRAGVTTALYVDSFVAPHLQELGAGDELTPYHAEKLAALLQDTPMGQQIVSFKVWTPRGKLIYSTDGSAVGSIYPMHEGMLRARLGEVVSEVSSLDDVENARLGELYPRLLETYSPVWLSGTDQIIAVAEFYQRTDELDAEMAALKRRSWLVVGLAGLLMYLLLAGFVRRASDTITRQQGELGRQVSQLTALLGQNQELHARVRRAAASVSLLNEGYLKRIGAELHDGPSQDLGLALLKLDAVIDRLENQPAPAAADHPSPGQAGAAAAQLVEIERSLQHALKEMREIAGGLSLPQLAELSLVETVIRAARNHERQTGSRVALELGELPEQAPLPVKVTLYRLIQEALNNAFRHAQGLGQRVQVAGQDGQLLVEISDRGPGFRPDQLDGREGRLGLGGMRERVESLGGVFEIDSRPGAGARVRASLPTAPQGEAL